MRKIAAIVSALSLGAIALPAQNTVTKPEIRPFVGASIPTGKQRDLFKNAPMYGVQAALELKPTMHLLGSFSYVPGQNKYSVARDNVNIFQYDAGMEFDMVHALGAGWELKPFVGLGAGARTYQFQSKQLNDKTCAAGYGALGTEFQYSPIALRLEARDNLFCYRSPMAGVRAGTRNDVGVAFGLAYHMR